MIRKQQQGNNVSLESLKSTVAFFCCFALHCTVACSDRCAHCDAVSTAHGHTDGARTTTRATKSRASFPPCGFGRAPPPDTGGASRSEEDMRGSSPMMRRRLLPPPPLLLLLCCSLAAVQPARALFHLRGAGTGAYVEQVSARVLCWFGCSITCTLLTAPCCVCR